MVVNILNHQQCAFSIGTSFCHLIGRNDAFYWLLL